MHNKEKGSVVVIFLAVFMVIALFLFAVFRFATVDYQLVAESFGEIKDRNQSNNVVEMVKPYLTEDIMGEPKIDILENIDEDDMKELRYFFESAEEVVYKDFINHIIATVDFGTDDEYEERCDIEFDEMPLVDGVADLHPADLFFDSCNLSLILETADNSFVESFVSSMGFADAEKVRIFAKDLRIVNSMKEFREEELKLFDYTFRADDRKGWEEIGEDTSKWDFEDFTNYEEVVNEYTFGDTDGNYGVTRTYSIEDNWLNNTIEDDSVYQEINDKGSLVLPDTIYLRLKFDPNVYMINLKMGNEFQTSDYEILNRSYGSSNEEDLYFLVKINENIPPTVDFIEITTDEESLGGTTFSILTGRELMIEVNRKELPNKDTVTVRRDKLTVEMKKETYEVYRGNQERGGE